MIRLFELATALGLALGNANPPLIWARVERDGAAYEVVGVHITYPFDPPALVAQVGWLAAFPARRPRPLVLAGDLNLAPFSWQLAGWRGPRAYAATAPWR